MDGKCLLFAKLASRPQKTRVTLSVFCETGSEKSPPGGETAPTNDNDPCLSSGEMTMLLQPLS